MVVHIRELVFIVHFCWWAHRNYLLNYPKFYWHAQCYTTLLPVRSGLVGRRIGRRRQKSKPKTWSGRTNGNCNSWGRLDFEMRLKQQSPFPESLGVIFWFGIGWTIGENELRRDGQAVGYNFSIKTQKKPIPVFQNLFFFFFFCTGSICLPIIVFIFCPFFGNKFC